MITYIGEWIQQIVLLVLVATFLHLLLPGKTMGRYVKLVIGLILIVIILTPVFDLFQIDEQRLTQSMEEILRQPSEAHHWEERIAQNQQSFERIQEEAYQQEVSQIIAEEMEAHVQADAGLKPHVEVLETTVTVFPGNDELYIDEVEMVLKLHDQPLQDGNSTTNIQDDAEQVSHVDQIDAVRVQVDVRNGATKETQLDEQKKAAENTVRTYLDNEWNISEDKVGIMWTRR